MIFLLAGILTRIDMKLGIYSSVLSIFMKYSLDFSLDLELFSNLFPYTDTCANVDDMHCDKERGKRTSDTRNLSIQ